MIIRSGLIQNKEDASFETFTKHWLEVHANLALQVKGMRAYSQNHIMERLPFFESGELPRTDGISQLYFDDVESMRIAMMSDEQAACIADLRGFLNHVTLVIQEEGAIRRPRPLVVPHLQSKYMFLLGGDRRRLEAFADELAEQLLRQKPECAMRFNPVIDRSFDVDLSIPAGKQVVDAILEIWVDAADDASRALIDLRTSSGELQVHSAFRVEEHVFSERSPPA